MNNITPSIQEKIGKNLHLNPDHPIAIIKNKIYDYFKSIGDFKHFDELAPVVPIAENFDKLRIPADHVSRGPSDTYYVDDAHVLRTHTSAHQNQLLSDGETCFLVTGDVYRKDAIDASHFPVFHQMEGVMVFDKHINASAKLREVITGLIETLFPGCDYNMREDKFPFTDPSWEVDVMYNGEELEVLGCGIVHKEIMQNCGLEDKVAWAFGLGLERLAMILFNIPDIRYFWTDDQRFHKQFKAGQINEFKPYSKYPACKKDISMWISDEFTENDFCEIARAVGGGLIESITESDRFTNPKTGRTSICYAISYRSNSRSLTNEEINKIHEELGAEATEQLHVEVR